METEIQVKKEEIADQLSSLKRRLEADYVNDERLLVWVIPGEFACSHRPLRHHPLFGGSGRNITSEATDLVEDWADTIYLLGIKSIICLTRFNIRAGLAFPIA